MHGKAMIVDKEWATIGSFNINFLSRYISIELNTDVSDREFALEFSSHLDKITDQGCVIVEKNALMWLAYCFFLILMNFTINKRGRKTQK